MLNNYKELSQMLSNKWNNRCEKCFGKAKDLWFRSDPNRSPTVAHEWHRITRVSHYQVFKL